MSQSDPRRRIPRTDALLALPPLAAAVARHGEAVVKGAITAGPDAGPRRGDRARGGRGCGRGGPATARNEPAAPHQRHRRGRAHQHRPGAVVGGGDRGAHHRSRLRRRRVRRGHRRPGRTRRGTLAALREAVPGAGGALVVNNGAAALVLATTALAAGREVVVSRGEMVEIGDGFRLPDLIASTGARLREVGTTNRTSLRDYADAVGPETGCILKVHPSNFRVEGFTSAVGLEELATLGVPVVMDIGSGLLAPDPLLPGEPDASTCLRQGATIVTASGDKAAGRPQAGLVLGDAEAVERLRRHPLARALRVDKLTLAALEATLRGPMPPGHRLPPRGRPRGAWSDGGPGCLPRPRRRRGRGCGGRRRRARSRPARVCPHAARLVRGGAAPRRARCGRTRGARTLPGRPALCPQGVRRRGRGCHPGGPGLPRG